jgi:hypothetical protein
MTSTTTIQHNTAALVSPTKNPAIDTLYITPKTMNEITLLGVLREAEACEASLKRRVIELQAANILNETYCTRLRGQLAHQEEKKANPTGNSKLMGSGLPCLLSGDGFYEKVIEHEAKQRQEEREKVARQQSREEREEVLIEWRAQQEERKEQITARRAEWEKEKEEWEQEKAAAKAAKKKFDRKKPTLGKLPLTIPKPKVTAMADDNGDGDDSENSDALLEIDE